MIGKVYLIGAGPGDYKLITVKGRECIEKADVIVYDYLADEKILRWAKNDAEIIYAGKQASQHTMTQEEINNVLVEKALGGKKVARLKGGDPLVFGRGGEEAIALGDAGVAFEIVPGVTSAIAAPAYAGIPVTHRGMATSFAVVTGHEDPTKRESSMHWEGLASSVDTICFLMGVGNLPYITEKLLDNGRAPHTPAAVVRWGTKGSQEVVVTTLEHASEDVAKANIKPPAVFIVGEVVNLRSYLQWFDNKPLFGKRIVVTRARAQASALVEQLEDLGADVLEAPAIRTLSLPLSDIDMRIGEKLPTYGVIVFTSAQGVEYFFERIQKLNIDVRSLHRAKICAIGSATAKALQNKGITVDFMPSNYQAEEVVTTLEKEVDVNLPVLLVQPLVARTLIPDELTKVGYTLDVWKVYETKQANEGVDQLKEALAAGTVDYITFTSSSTVTNTLQLLGSQGPSLINNASVVCIGPITAQTCEEHDLEPRVVSDTFTVDAMVLAICKDVEKEIKS